MSYAKSAFHRNELTEAGAKLLRLALEKRSAPAPALSVSDLIRDDVPEDHFEVPVFTAWSGAEGRTPSVGIRINAGFAMAGLYGDRKKAYREKTCTFRVLRVPSHLVKVER